MKPRLLVVSTVHPADDPRIRRKLIGTLQSDWEVTYAGHGRGPVDSNGLSWRELTGGRFVRFLRAGRLLLSRGYDVASLHDPELLPLGILAARMGRKVVFDVHENVPAQLATKEWIRRPLRRPLAAAMSWVLRVGEKRLAITLAEAGYAPLFRAPHPIFPNYLIGNPPVPRDSDPETGIVYLGDVTEARGLEVAVAAAGAAGVPVFSIMGRCTPEFRARLLAVAGDTGVELRFHGFVTPDRALEIAAGAVLGLSPLLDIPNYRESLPTKVLEYLAVGVPTIASDLPGTRAVLADKPGAVLVAAGDTEAWAAALRAAATNPQLRTEARSGVARIREEYVWPTADVRQFYRSLLPGDVP